MNILIGLGIALAVSMIGNVWLFNSRDDALAAAKRNADTAVANLETANKCSDSVKELQQAAVDAAAKAAVDIEAAKKVAQTNTNRGVEIITRERTVPNDECKSTSNLLQGWLKERQPK